jgi:uncharacterized glyoxalase superfamily protein PhnB
MIANRSVPTDTIVAHVVYQNLSAALAWLTKAFGFTEHFRYGDPNDPGGVQVLFGKAVIMLQGPRGSSSPAQLGYGTQSLTLFIEDVDAHYAKAKSAGATIVEEPHETEYGEYQYAALDLDGHHWLFSRHAHDRSPEAWGATLAPRPKL